MQRKLLIILWSKLSFLFPFSFLECREKERSIEDVFSFLHLRAINSQRLALMRLIASSKKKRRHRFALITIKHNFFFIYCFLSFNSLSREERKQLKMKNEVWLDRDGFLDRASFSFSWKRFQPTARSSLRLIVMCCRLKPKRRNDFHGQESMIHVLTSSFSFCWPFNQPQADGQQ